jgi:hypothetical protein
MLFGRVVQWVANWADDRIWRRRAALVLVGVMLVAGIERGIRNRIEFVQALPDRPHHVWVRDNAREGDLFLTQSHDLDFRLAAQQPQYVSLKTHPHRPASVVEWYARLRKAEAVANAREVSCARLEELAGEGVTHLVRWRSPSEQPCPGWRTVYEDAEVVIFSRRP